MANTKSSSSGRTTPTQTRKARLESFRAFKTGHPLLISTYEELRQSIRDAEPGSIIFMSGPTGVGKTTILEHITEHLKSSTLSDLEEDPERIPVLNYQIVNPISSNFDWKDHFKRLLETLEEPIVNHKLEIENWGAQRPDHLGGSESNLQLIGSEKPATRALRIAAERTLKRRRLVAILLDEAQHLGVTSSGRQLLNQLNIIKSLAEKSKTTHVLCGTYELLPLRNLNGQLSRRSIDIHFSRYHAEHESQRQQFINVLYTFQERLPLEETPDLVSRWDYFYERSIGRVGVLKDWLRRSLALALADNSPTLKLKYVERRALSIKQCTSMLRETMLGEREFEESDELRSLFRRNLGLDAKPLDAAQGSIPLINLDNSSDKQPKRRQRRVGRRNPIRDKIGTTLE